jgi:hypothetical protein
MPIEIEPSSTPRHGFIRLRQRIMMIPHMTHHKGVQYLVTDQRFHHVGNNLALAKQIRVELRQHVFNISGTSTDALPASIAASNSRK